MGHDFKFWGTVGAVMTALKLKDAYDDYQQLPQNEEGQRRAGPISLRSPIDGEYSTHQEDLELDTTLPTIARPKRKRHADCCCCACCGLRCGIFWKAFGAVLSLVFVWQTLRFIFWSAKPTPTGLENMPKFNASLECKNAVYTFNPDTTTYSVPFNISRASHTVQLQGDAFGTFIITEGAQDATAIKYDLVLRSNDETLLSDVSFKYPTQEQVDDGRASSQATLDTPVSISGADGTSCARFDIVLYVPPQLRELTIFSSSLVHLKFASRTRSGITLDKLEISVDSPHQNLILPTASIRANDLRLLVRKGYLVGDVSIIDSTTLETRYGDAVANVHVYPSSEEGLEDAKLTTNTGDGRADFFFMAPTPPSSSSSSSPSSGNGEEDDHDEPHRQIASKHTASGVGDLYLKYERSGFSGRVSLKAGSATTRNMHAIDYHKSFTRGWVREEDGKDRLNIKAGRNTWVGLYF